MTMIFTFCFYNIFLMSHNFFFFKLFGDKDTTFPRNFQGFREKILERGRRTKKNRRLPELRAAYWLYYFYYDETDDYSTVQ